MMSIKSDAHGQNTKELRIVLVGKTGVGKSAAGNTILGKMAFKSKLASSSVTQHCNKQRGEVEGMKVAVVDTPGVLDTLQKEVITEIKQCISFSAPGPHVFLVVLQLGRFTREEQETVKIIQTTFGVEAEKYTMVLFTNGGNLEPDDSMEDFVKDSPGLKNFLDKCKGGFHVFDNKDKNPFQVTELLEKINHMVGRNKGSHYTNEMFQEAERAIQEEKEKILRENEEQRNGEMEQLERQLEGEILKKHQEVLRKKHELEAREKAEKDNAFIRNCTIAAIAGGVVGVVGGGISGGTGGLVGQEIGRLVGASLGAAAGPVGVAAVAAIGTVAGAAVGAATIYISDKCTVM